MKIIELISELLRNMLNNIFKNAKNAFLCEKKLS